MPTFVPPRPFERGYRGRPTLIQNPETLAQLALVARFGADWYRELGTVADPGSALVTITGAVARARRLRAGLRDADGRSARGRRRARRSRSRRCSSAATSAPGSRPRARGRLRLAREDLRSVGCSLGSGVLIALGRERLRPARERARDRLPGRAVGRPVRAVRVRSARDRRRGRGRWPTGSRIARERERVLRWTRRDPGARRVPPPRRGGAVRGERARVFAPRSSGTARPLQRAPAGLPRRRGRGPGGRRAGSGAARPSRGGSLRR